jgi:signal transduction histidine kinase
MVGLAKGTYLLQIRGYDDLGKTIRFSPTEIIVKEDFYKSDVFISILAFITFLLLILIFRVLYNRLKMKNKIYEKISMDLHDEVGTLLSKTALMIAQKDFLETEMRNKIQENIKQANFGLRTNINSIKHYDRQLIYIYYECIEVMESFLTVKNIPYHYSFEGRKDKKITKSLYKDLKLCFFEIFNNTIKYSSTNGIEVKFSEKQNELTILITEKNNYLDFSQIDYGNGLKNIQKRMERNHGTVHYISDKEKKAYIVILKIKL